MSTVEQNSNSGSDTADKASDGEVSMIPVFAESSDDSDRCRAVKVQLGVWDQLLQCRIKLQPCVSSCNRLPKPAVWRPYWCQSSTRSQLEQLGQMSDSLLSLLEDLELAMWRRFPETHPLALLLCDDNALSASAVSGLCGAEKRHSLYRPHRNLTINKWNDKTRLLTSAKSFQTFQQSTLHYIDQIMADRDRLIRRTQLRRVEMHALGQPSANGNQQQNGAINPEYDEDLFDDGDFYHQLLREIIERKTTDATNAISGKHWINIQKLRSKVKKKVDTRASKGRKVRYEVYPKLVNLMASSGSVVAARARADLICSLFDRQPKLITT